MGKSSVIHFRNKKFNKEMVAEYKYLGVSYYIIIDESLKGHRMMESIAGELFIWGE